jgi:hypothetical protein
MFCGIGSISHIPHNPHIQTEYGEYLEILHRILLVPHNTVMDLNNVMSQQVGISGELLQHQIIMFTWKMKPNLD